MLPPPSYMVPPAANKVPLIEDLTPTARPKISPAPCSYTKPVCECCRSELSFTVGTHLIPHPAKVHTGGEDAFFVSISKGGVLAIADGVSGWAERGVNPALFSRELMANASNLVMNEEVNCNPQMLLMKAHAATSSTGSATAIVAMLEKNGVLNIANVGDCGLRIFRKGLLIFTTSPQEHYFNCPYQLSSEKAGQTYHDAMEGGTDEVRASGGMESRVGEEEEERTKLQMGEEQTARQRRVNEANDVCSVKLLEGDTIVMGSDGFFDNVFDHEIVAIISQFKDAADDAKRLADLANTHSTDVNFDSPYSLEARSRGFDVPLWRKVLGQKLTGGKPDDITVIVGHVHELHTGYLEESEAVTADLSPLF
ncbi:putative protein phosphatase 2C 1 [Dendrobium catenatum]|uniref:Protein phosphatase n=1 Tax=Dendrobium catenatum TaxID=906689 RepID=A0A2I0X9G2_9ASPA|nr:putative protein phosphatase 2C 1 [Dendrobium catenatum]